MRGSISVSRLSLQRGLLRALIVENLEEPLWFVSGEVFSWTEGCNLRGHLQRCEMPDIENSRRKNSRKGCRVGHAKAAEKQPEKQPRNTRKTVVLTAFRLFFGCFSAVFPAVFQLLYRYPLGTLLGGGRKLGHPKTRAFACCG